VCALPSVLGDERLQRLHQRRVHLDDLDLGALHERSDRRRREADIADLDAADRQDAEARVDSYAVSVSAAFDGLSSSMNAAIAFVSFIRHLGPSLPLAAGRWVPRCARKDISRHFRC